MNAQPTMARVFRKETYERVAQAMNGSKPATALSAGAPDSVWQWRRDCEGLADMFAAQSAAFDRAMFLKNCGVAVEYPPHEPRAPGRVT